MKSKDLQQWLLLVHQLPPKPTSLRVRTWRKLQSLGAVSIKNSVYVLPFNEKMNEDFQWLRQEIEASGGEASVFRAATVEGASDREIVKTFQDERAAEYKKLAAEFDALTGATKAQERGRHLTGERLKKYRIEFNKLHTELERIKAIDFFQAKERQTAFSAFKRARHTVHKTIDGKSKQTGSDGAEQKTSVLAVIDYQGKRWATRRNLHVDRLASAWLIRRFIDKKARFYFIGEDDAVENTVRFDMFGGEFTHRGEDCTFETLIKQFGLTADKGLGEIAEIVHDIDLKDNKFNRLETAGFDAVVRGLSLLLCDDRRLLNQCQTIFDGLYEKLTENALLIEVNASKEKSEDGD